MPPNLPTTRLHIRRKPATSHHSRMKIAIRALRLAERHLYVNSELPHNPKTLAHPARKPLEQCASILGINAKPSLWEGASARNGNPRRIQLAQVRRSVFTCNVCMSPPAVFVVAAFRPASWFVA